MIALIADSAVRERSRIISIAGRQGAAGKLGLTDLCLFTDARYTRHLTQADRFAAFQDHPGALEHFPSGSLAGPPGKVTNALPPCCMPQPARQSAESSRAGS